MAGVKQPADKSYFILPDLGEGVAEAELIEWKVTPGQTVDEHQTLAEMETDKARVEVPSPWAGVVRELRGNPGDIIRVGSKLVTYDTGPGPGPAASAAQAPESKSVAKAPQRSFESEASSSSEREDAGTVVGSVGAEMKISDRFARRRAEHDGAARDGGKALATPAVRRIARELGVDIDRVEGTGRGGRVTAGDVENFSHERGSAAAPARPRQDRGTGLPTTRVRERDDHAEDRITRPVLQEDFSASARDQTSPPARPISGDGISQRIPFRGVRRKIAQALRHSVSTTVHFTVVDEADVTDLDRKRRELIFATGEKISLLPFILLGVIKALREHPAMNANVDDEKEEILLKNVINLGIAVDTEHGLMVPVLANADRSSVFELHRRVKDVAARCKDRSIPREELIGGTFTISNVGSYGGMFATPIINYPEVGILAAGRARERVVPRGGGFHLGTILPLSLSCDHRVVDGAEGARFLNTVVKLLENPEKLLRP